jgi:hypothetical protein
VITSQEKLNELVSGLEGLKIELARRWDQKTAGRSPDEGDFLA